MSALGKSLDGSYYSNYLNYLAEQEHSRSFKFPVPKGEIALLLGITPETFSRMLRKLVDENIITIKGKGIHLLRQWDNFRDSGDIVRESIRKPWTSKEMAIAGKPTGSAAPLHP